MKNDHTHQWFALYTKARAEKKVLEQLQSLGIDVYLPLRKELRQWSDRKKLVEMPVISSYVFVYITASEYLKVFAAKGVVAYVTYKGKAVPIPDCEIDAMRRAVDQNVSFSVETASLQKGQTVTITSGPLTGVSGEVIDIKGQKKLYLRISHIGYTLVIDLTDDVTVIS